ncbi:MAG TPA: DegT/DnrJ/EryC1/StrS family aminotransferase [Candidatus Binatia bacterium]|nr:DegT/DnrJ/EryC1/StrS family aminotransferase [Candidatus Binatia bacterium]
MSQGVPFFDLTAQYAALKPEIDAALARVLARGQFILGKEVEAFEAEFAAMCGVRYAVGINSGTTALILGLLALGVRPGDEVVTVSHTFVATAEAISLVGATPVFVDIEETHCTMDPVHLRDAITPRTKAIVPVHLYGHPAGMDAICQVAHEWRLPVLEDACQAHGALYKGRPIGSLGDAACFSFYPSKNLGAYGEAGALVTDDPAIAHKARILRDHGSESKYTHSVVGLNGRMEEIQAAVLHTKLPHLATWNARRRQLARLYDKLLADVPRCRPIGEDATVQSSYHLYVVRVPRRDAVREALASEGIGTQIHYPIPVHRQKAYAGSGQPTGELTVTDATAAEVLSLPLYPELDEDSVRRVADTLRRAMAEAV